jgi:hypothetical protein
MIGGSKKVCTKELQAEPNVAAAIEGEEKQRGQ